MVHLPAAATRVPLMAEHLAVTQALPVALLTGHLAGTQALLVVV